MNLIIVGNPGKFSNEINNLLSENFRTDLFYIDKEIPISSTTLKIKDKLIKNKHDNSFLIYLGGETRKESIMEKFNKDLLLEIANLCKKSNINLIYLSSISVYGIPKNNYVTTKSIRKPVSFYGHTKNIADIILMNKKSNILIFNLLPASIIVHNSKKGLYNKLILFMRKKPIKILFYLLCPGGQFSFCTSKEIANEIEAAIKFSGRFLKENSLKNIFYFEKIVSRSIKIKDIFYESNFLFPLFILPKINIKIIKIFSKFLNYHNLLRFIFFFSNVEYKNK